MADAPRSSFIPKQTKTAVSSRVHKKKRFNTLGLISTVVLIASLVLAGGTYFYRGYAEKELEEEKQALAEESGRFNESDIESVQELDRMFAAADLLLANHTAPSRIFDALEETTKELIQFTDFSFSRDSRQSASLTIRGATEEFKSVALQALEYGDDPLFSNAVFSELSNSQEAGAESEEGTAAASPDQPEITFSVTGNIASGLLMYEGQPTASEPAPDSSPENTGTSTSSATGTSTDTGAADVTDT